MQQPQIQPLTVRLRKKYQANDLDYYDGLVTSIPFNLGQQAFGQQFIQQTLIPSIQQNPQQYFNFGFSYNDFKAYVMKITFCRALRVFIQRKRLQKILQFQNNNPQAAFLCGFNQEKKQEDLALKQDLKD